MDKFLKKLLNNFNLKFKYMKIIMCYFLTIFLVCFAKAQISYKVEYKIVTEKCHYCNKVFSLKYPLKIYNISGSEPANVMAIEVAKFFENSLKMQLYEKEDCSSTLNRNTTHEIQQEELSNSDQVNSFNYSKSVVDEFINNGSIQRYGTSYPNTLRDSYQVVFAAYKNGN